MNHVWRTSGCLLIVAAGWLARHDGVLANDGQLAASDPNGGGAGAVQTAAADLAQLESDWLRQYDRRERGPVGGKGVTPADDARGGCDGIKTGGWGFHTEQEANPWWQVDLGQVTSLSRVVLYNRCDLPQRAGQLQVLVSEDAQQFQQVYQHDGTAFLGFTDNKPLTIPLPDVTARYVRLRLPGTSYFHLDEVEIQAAAGGPNVALGKAATQSSTSQWSVAHQVPLTLTRQAIAVAIQRGKKLADDLVRRGGDVASAAKALKSAEQQLTALAADAPRELQEQMYLDVRGIVRRLALRNPLLDFDSILFVKSAPGRFPHMSDQFYGWWSRPGGGVFLLRGFKNDQPELVCLTADLPEGNFLRPELSYDGQKVLFAYCRYYPHVADLRDKADKANLPEDAFYHVYEMNIDGTARRQLTRGRYDDFDARYLPNGDIVFLSTRKGTFLQCSQANTLATAAADLPDSYVRCGGDNYRPVPVFTMHAIDGDGGNLRPISAFENFEWTPAVANDGTILYTRWDYIDRFNGHFFSLWSTNPDGTNAQLVYGNYTVRPQVVAEAVPIPNSRKLVFTASAHHSILGGSLVLLDRNRGLEGDAPITRLTPEVPFPETEANVDSYYANPWPLSEEHFLVSWSDRKLPPHSRVDNTEQNPVNALGLYLYDAFGNLNLLYRDPALSSSNPIPVRPRPRPLAYQPHVAWDGLQEGSFLVQDVNQGLESYQGQAGVPRGTVKALRVIGVPPKVQPHMNHPNLGISHEDPGKFVLGTVPVEADGSAYFRAPSGIPIFFQALDANGVAVQTMRSLTYVGAGQTLACVGCHEPRATSSLVNHGPPLAAAREPSRLQPGPAGSWPLRFDHLVQPVLDKSCVSCHAPNGPAAAAALDLTPAQAYDSLLAFGEQNLRELAKERDRSYVNDGTARNSKLLALLQTPGGHHGVQLDADAFNRLVTWMDLYAQRQGHYSDQQEQQLLELRDRLLSLLAP